MTTTDQTKKTRFKSLSARIILVSIAVFCVVLTLLSILIIYQETIFLGDNFNHRGQDMLTSVSEASRIALLAENRDRLVTIADENLLHRREVLYTIFYSPDGQQIYGAIKNGLLPGILDQVPPELLHQEKTRDTDEWRKGLQIRNRTVDDTGEVSEFWTVIKSPKTSELGMFDETVTDSSNEKTEQAIGYICLGLSTKGLRDTTSRIIRDTVFFGFAALFIMSVITVLLFKRLTKPLSELVQGVQEVADGKLEKTITVRSEDEVGRLANEFNKMVVSLKERQAMLLESESRYRSLFEGIHHGILLFDEDGLILACNPAMARIVDYPEAQTLINIDLDGLFKDAADYEQLIKQIQEGDVIHDQQLRLLRRDGKEIETTISVTRRTDENQVFEYAEAVIVDISHQKDLERRLLHAHKMEAVGTLAGGIAHDFNNILTGITGYTSLMSMLPEVTKNTRFLNYIEAIQKNSKRAADLVSQLMGFARKGLFHEGVVQINSVVEELQSLLRETIDRRIHLNIDLTPELWGINGDESQIYQSLLNLCLNSCDAMPNGGDLLITTENILNREDLPTIDAVMPAGRYTCIKITDNGIGMDEETIEKIFEPFFTTKAIHKGTGLGMAMVHGIIKNHQGYIHVASQPGKGTTMAIYLPAAEKTAEPKQTKKSGDEEKAASPGPASILLVDDEEMIRNFCTLFFPQFDFTILTASSGEEALDILANKRRDIDLVVLDISMPGIGGPKTFTIMQQLYPDLPVIVATGYAKDDTVNRLLEQGAAALVLKPFDGKDLLTAINSVLFK